MSEKSDEIQKIKDAYDRLKADQYNYKVEENRIDGGRFNLVPGKDASKFWNDYTEMWYYNDEPTKLLFQTAAQQALNNKDVMRQLRREYRQERRDFRRQEREDYRKRKDIYKKRHA